MIFDARHVSDLDRRSHIKGPMLIARKTAARFIYVYYIHVGINGYSYDTYTNTAQHNSMK
jgi:hypothetical protein